MRYAMDSLHFNGNEPSAKDRCFKNAVKALNK